MSFEDESDEEIGLQSETNQNSDEIIVYIKSVDGEDIPIEINKNQKINDLIKKIREKRNLLENKASIFLYHNGHQLGKDVSKEEEKTLGELGIKNEDNFTILVRLKGGKF